LEGKKSDAGAAGEKSKSLHWGAPRGEQEGGLKKYYAEKGEGGEKKLKQWEGDNVEASGQRGN